MSEDLRTLRDNLHLLKGKVITLIDLEKNTKSYGLLEYLSTADSVKTGDDPGYYFRKFQIPLHSIVEVSFEQRTIRYKSGYYDRAVARGLSWRSFQAIEE